MNTLNSLSKKSGAKQNSHKESRERRKGTATNELKSKPARFAGTTKHAAPETV